MWAYVFVCVCEYALTTMFQFFSLIFLALKDHKNWGQMQQQQQQQILTREK